MDRLPTVSNIISGFIKLLLVFTLTSLTCLPEATLGAYEFDKVRFLLSTNNAIDTLRLTNPEKDKTINLQLNVMQWSQENGKDIYKQTKDLIVAPPVVKIPPGKTQLVRIAWRRPAPVTQELSYRVFIQDLTPYTPLQNTILFKLTASMPVFIAPTSPTMQAQWQVKRIGSHQLKVTLKNTGNIHIQVGTLTLTNSNNTVLATTNASTYVLPQQSVSATLETKTAIGNSAVIIANTDNGKLAANVNIS